MALPPAARRLCDRCLGRRLVGAAGEGPQRDAARQARQADGMAELPEHDCAVCEGAFAESGKWLECAVAAAKPYHFASFQVGTKFPGPGEGLERDVAAAMGQEKVGETIRTEANRWLAARLSEATGAKPVTEGRPELVLTVDTRYWTCQAEPAPAYLRGRYNKLRRDIPQTHWPCRRCQGRGCWECGDSGVTYAESVEDAIGKPAIPAFAGSGYAFHGAGREDIDALMLGTGRPFVLEVKHPRRRTADLAALESAINATTATSGVAVRELRPAGVEEVAAIKEADYAKEYVAHCAADGPITRVKLEGACALLTGTTLEQRTPDRVAHRRADLVRKRKVHACSIEAMPEDPGATFALRVRAESGTYIKELVSGDEGRTTPSLSALLETPCKVAALDVVAILDGD